MSCPTPCLRTGAGRVFHEFEAPVETSLACLWSPMESTGRFFLCVCCRSQVVICSHCDRGQIYCAADCAQAARCHAVREAGRRYQTSRRGRFAHAERSRRYRTRQKNVTHQASPALAPDDLLAASSTLMVEASSKAIPTALSTRVCHFCGRPCAQFVRTGPLRRRVPRNVCRADRRGTDNDYSP